MADEVYVRRRRWSAAEKQRIVTEADTCGNVIATAKRYGIQAQQIYRWRERVGQEDGAAGFMPIAFAASGSVIPDPTPVLDHSHGCEGPAPALDLASRIDITLHAGHRLSIEGRFDVAAILALARGLEAIR
ncbi:MAG: transposase [Proteobacteria bacterium]|nr:transposase [Pseudomonadota bacterium]